MKHYLLFPGLLATLLCYSCDKNDPDALPKQTQHGANTAGFVLDGKALPAVRCITCLETVGGNYYSIGKDKVFTFGMQNHKTSAGTVELSVLVTNPKTGGVYQLGEGISSVGQHVMTQGFATMKRYDDKTFLISASTDPANAGTLTLTRFDTVAHIAAGTFTFPLRDDDTGQFYYATDGRFDLHYNE